MPVSAQAKMKRFRAVLVSLTDSFLRYVTKKCHGEDTLTKSSHGRLLRNLKQHEDKQKKENVWLERGLKTLNGVFSLVARARNECSSQIFTRSMATRVCSIFRAGSSVMKGRRSCADTKHCVFIGEEQNEQKKNQEK